MVTLQEAKERAGKLRKEIEYHRYNYHVLNRQEISQDALDSLKHELVKLEERFPSLATPDSPTMRVAGKPLPGFKKVRHDTPMLSLNDAFSEDELVEWEGRIRRLAGPTAVQDGIEYFTELKIDGFAISLLYEAGHLKIGSTRGDGVTGENVTANLKTIESIPLRLHTLEDIEKNDTVTALIKEHPNIRRVFSRLPRVIEVRGEVFMSKRAFDEVNEEQKKKGLSLFANPRNVAAGSVRILDPRITATRKLDFYAYGIVTDMGQETHEEEHIIAKLLGFKTAEPSKKSSDTAHIIRFWKNVLDMRAALPYLIDGVVAQANSRLLFEKLGVAGKAPRGAVAFKFPAEEATTTIEDIIVQVGRTGVLTPVAVLTPILVGGVMVSRATLHNMDEIERLDARVGDTVIVRRAGDVIPNIAKVLKHLRPEHAKKFRMPRMFCGQPVIRRGTEVAHHILRPEKCGLVQRERFYHVVSKSAFDIEGLGQKIVDRLIDEGLVRDPADLFDLKEGDVVPLERFAEKSAENLIHSIQEKKTIAFPRFLFALGILHVGEETAHDLAEHFGSLDELMRAPLEDLERTPNIGTVVSKEIYDWFRDKKNQEFVKKLLDRGVKIISPAQKQKRVQTLKGLTFVLTGGLETMTREEAKERIRARGGKISESVNQKTNYIVAGLGSGSKLQKAHKLHLTVIDEKQFSRMIK